VRVERIENVGITQRVGRMAKEERMESVGGTERIGRRVRERTERVRKRRIKRYYWLADV
jgi:hypothetical protein